MLTIEIIPVSLAISALFLWRSGVIQPVANIHWLYAYNPTALAG